MTCRAMSRRIVVVEFPRASHADPRSQRQARQRQRKAKASSNPNLRERALDSAMSSLLHRNFRFGKGFEFVKHLMPIEIPLVAIPIQIRVIDGSRHSLRGSIDHGWCVRVGHDDNQLTFFDINAEQRSGYQTGTGQV